MLKTLLSQKLLKGTIIAICILQGLCAVYFKYLSHYSLTLGSIWAEIFIFTARAFDTISPLLCLGAVAGGFIAFILLIACFISRHQKDSALLLSGPYIGLLILECTVLPGLDFYCLLDALV